MNALGMIETYGYLTAVEALDSALKAANVFLVDVVRVRGGLVTVLIGRCRSGCSRKSGRSGKRACDSAA